MPIHVYCSINAYKKSFFPSTVRLWNGLPAIVISAPTCIGIGRFEILEGQGGEGWGRQTLSWLETDQGAPCPHFELWKAISCILGTFTVQFVYVKRYIYYRYYLTLHLETFVICFLLLHTEIEGKCGMWVDYWGPKVCCPSLNLLEAPPPLLRPMLWKTSSPMSVQVFHIPILHLQSAFNNSRICKQSRSQRSCLIWIYTVWPSGLSDKTSDEFFWCNFCHLFSWLFKF